MDPATAIALAVEAFNAIKAAASAYEEIKNDLSQTDLATIQQNLLNSEQALAILRPQVDAALDAASKL